MTIHTFARMLDVLTIAQKEALEGYLYWYRVREGKATTTTQPEKYPDYVEARLAAIAVLRQLADLEAMIGTERVRGLLTRALSRARAAAREEASHDTASE